MHEFPVWDRTGDILPVIFIHGYQYRDGEGLADSYREPLRAGLAHLNRSVVDNGSTPGEGGKPDNEPDGTPGEGGKPDNEPDKGGKPG